MRRTIVTTLIALGLAFGLAFAQNAAQDGAVQEGPVDPHFLQAAAQGDLYELTSSQMALDRSTNEDVQAFAQRMFDDHTMTTQRITDLAEAIGVELPMSPAPTHQVKIVQLLESEDAQFDLLYMQQQVIVHQDAVSLFEAAAMHAEDENVRAAAEELLPALQEHLQMAQDLVGQLQ